MSYRMYLLSLSHRRRSKRTYQTPAKAQRQNKQSNSTMSSGGEKGRQLRTTTRDFMRRVAPMASLLRAAKYGRRGPAVGHG